MTAVHVKVFEIEPGRNSVDAGDTGTLAFTSAKPYPFANRMLPSFTMTTTAPAISSRCSCEGTMPSRKALTSLAVICCACFEALSDDPERAAGAAGLEAWARIPTGKAPRSEANQIQRTKYAKEPALIMMLLALYVCFQEVIRCFSVAVR